MASDFFFKNVKELLYDIIPEKISFLYEIVVTIKSKGISLFFKSVFLKISEVDTQLLCLIVEGFSIELVTFYFDILDYLDRIMYTLCYFIWEWLYL